MKAIIEQELSKCGKYIVNLGRKAVAKIYYRPVFFAGTKVNFNPVYPYCLEMSLGARECASLEEVLIYLEKHS